MRAGRAVLILVAILLPALARAQSGTDTSLDIPVHPRVSTILQLPDAIEHAWITDSDDFRVAIVDNQLYVRPRPGTPIGVEGLLEVKTRTIRRAFQLRVVERAGDARQDVLVLVADAEQDIEEAAPEATPVVPAELVEPLVPAVQEPAASAPTSAAPAPAAAPAERDIAADTRRGAAAAGASRFDLSVHAIVGLGATAVDLAGYKPGTGWQPHQTLGVRLAGEPRGSRWGLELDISGERLAGSLTYNPDGAFSELDVSGPWLRAMLSMRARVETSTRWIVSASAGIGAQAHLRRTKTLDNDGEQDSSSTMNRGGVLALGVGLQYRARDVLLGVEFRVWQGAPDEYRSIAAFLTVGRFLDQGDAP